MHIPHSKKFYRLIEEILKKLILFFKNTKNQKLRKAGLSAIYKAHEKNKFLLKVQENENFIVYCKELASKEIFVNGSCDFLKFEKTVSIIKKFNELNTLVNVGANIGGISIPALTRKFFKEAILIEPEQLNFRILMVNIYLNELEKRVTAHNIALTDKNNSQCRLVLNNVRNFGDHRIANGPIESDTLNEKSISVVKGETLDKIAPNLKRENSLIFMDAQGHEGFILRGAKQNIKKKIPIVLEFTPRWIKENGSYDYFKLLLCYSVVYDLSEIKPTPVEFNEVILKNLFEKYIQSENLYTDLLFV